MTDRNRWILHIKKLRAEHGVGLSEAERMALVDPQWRRWVEHQVNTDDQCRRMALRHIREWSANALIERDGDRLRVIGEPGAEVSRC
ncbi:hypothetical protein [Sphingomonas sp.]|uniref:hypothetical protein n=1 Tax=Sphingomonas sp. TaxID=28214 RepID=UPI0025E1FEE4|nr:hypothetical protein [Sphingomonas sp.]